MFYFVGWFYRYVCPDEIGTALFGLVIKDRRAYETNSCDAFFLFFASHLSWVNCSIINVNDSQPTNFKKYSSHATAMKLIGQKQLVYKIPILHEKLKFLWICEIWGNFLKDRYFANNCLNKAQIWDSFYTHVTWIIVIIFRPTNCASTKLNFSCTQISLPNFAFFSSKSPSIT